MWRLSLLCFTVVSRWLIVHVSEHYAVFDGISGRKKHNPKAGKSQRAFLIGLFWTDQNPPETVFFGPFPDNLGRDAADRVDLIMYAIRYFFMALKRKKKKTFGVVHELAVHSTVVGTARTCGKISCISFETRNTLSSLHRFGLKYAVSNPLT